MATRVNSVRRAAAIALALVLGACASVESPKPDPFTIAVIPDTQNMVSYKHQPAEGFALDAGAQFQQQMATIAQWRDGQANPLAFAIGVGEVWQHQSEEMGEEHRGRGFKAIANPYFGSELAVTERVLTEEVPRARDGYRLLADAGISFGVAPGNHDHDAMWSADGFPPRMDIPPGELQIIPEHLGMLHIGGEQAVVRVRTYSSHHGKFSSELPDHAEWYRKYEQPQMTDTEFLAQDEFKLVLQDFQARFGGPR